MRTFFTPSRRPTQSTTLPRPRPHSASNGYGHAGRSQDGFTLIEVVVSSLIVAVITIATFAGFDVLGRADADQRHHNEATVIAAQSQETLRSNPAATLDELANTAAGHTYTQTVQGVKYTVTQSAKFENGATGVTTCNAASSHANENSYYIRVSSSVKWGELGKNRPAVTETSIITPPVGSALEVDITNGGKPEADVAGVTVFSEGVETTTGENGCVIYNGIPATTANVEAYKRGWVTKSGEHIYKQNEVSIAPNVITHVAVNLAQGGAITAKFLYNGGSTYKRGTVTETVMGDTFVVFNNSIGVSPENEVGSTHFEYNSEGDYAAVAEKYEATATTPIEPTDYPYGDLFPFTTSWSVYAGDCAQNNPEKYSIKAGEATVTAGNDVSASVPMSYVALSVYKGTKESEGLTTVLYPVKVVNVSCTTPEPALPNNSYKAPYNKTYSAVYTHTNSTTTEAHLTQPFQPFGKFSLCLYNETAKKTYTSTYTNSTVAGSKFNIFLGDAAGTYPEGSGTSLVETTVATVTKNTC